MPRVKNNPKMYDEEEELFIYLLVRTDVNMGKGKIAAQCCHAVQDLILNPFCPKHLFNAYRKGHNAKVCLKVLTLEHLESINVLCQEKGVLHHLVIDAGRTQVPENTPTVLGIGPITKKTAQSFLGNLKLL